MRSHIRTAGKFGEAQDYPHLTLQQQPADEYDAWEIAEVAEVSPRLLHARAICRAPREHGLTFMAITNAWQAAEAHLQASGKTCHF